MSTLAFRPDLDEATQCMAIEKFRRNRSAELLTNDWRMTHARRSDHQIMLHMLVNEAMQHPHATMSKHEAATLHRYIHVTMMSSKHDPYVFLLSEVAKGRYFSSSSSSLAKDDGGTVNKEDNAKEDRCWTMSDEDKHPYAC